MTEGAVGSPPSWYRLVQAAKYLQVPPWELAERPVWWVSVALESLSAENAAQRHHNERSKG